MLVLELCDDLNFIHGLSVNSPPEETPASTIPLLSTTPALITAASEAIVSTTPSQTPEPLGNGTTVIPGETSFDGVLRIVTLDGKPALFNASLEAPGNSYYLTLHDNVVKIVSFSPTNKVSLLHVTCEFVSLSFCVTRRNSSALWVVGYFMPFFHFTFYCLFGEAVGTQGGSRLTG